MLKDGAVLRTLSAPIHLKHGKAQIEALKRARKLVLSYIPNLDVTDNHTQAQILALSAFLFSL